MFIQDGFNKLYWGFLFIMIDFRFNGFDVLPDIIGYILFAIGLNALIQSSEKFRTAANLNIVMLILSVFSIYERPAQQGGGINFGPMGFLGVIIGIATVVVSLLGIYNIFMGIRDMAGRQGQMDICEEANRRWNQYLFLSVAVFFAIFLIFIPPLALLCFFAILIASIALTLIIMGFMKRCGERLGNG